MYPFILKLEYWDDIEPEWKFAHIHVLVYAETMSAAVAQVESSNYVPNLENVKVISAGDDGQLFEIPGHIAKILAAGGGNYREGLREIKSSVIRDKLHADAEVVHKGFMKDDGPYVAPGTIAPWADSNEEE